MQMEEQSERRTEKKERMGIEDELVPTAVNNFFREGGERGDRRRLIREDVGDQGGAELDSVG